MLNFYLIFLEILCFLYFIFLIKEANEHNSFIYLFIWQTMWCTTEVYV